MGRVATYFLIGGCFLQLFAPLVFLLDLSSRADPAGPGGSLLLLLASPNYLLSIGDFLLILGVVILAASVFLILFSLVRADTKVGLDAIVLGVVAFACLAAWVPAMLYAEGRATGAIDSVDAAAATGGWGVASLLMLGASLAYLFLCVRVENGSRRGIASLRWPMYGAAGVFGSAALAGFFAGGAQNMDAFSLGLVLKATLIPMLGVMAFADLRDRFPRWERLPLQTTPRVAARRVARRRSIPARPVAMTPIAMPLPPPPDD